MAIHALCSNVNMFCLSWYFGDEVIFFSIEQWKKHTHIRYRLLHLHIVWVPLTVLTFIRCHCEVTEMPFGAWASHFVVRFCYQAVAFRYLKNLWKCYALKNAYLRNNAHTTSTAYNREKTVFFSNGYSTHMWLRNVIHNAKVA